MRALILLLLLGISLSYSLEYSTLELNVLNQHGESVEGVNFFLNCKMSFTTVERFLCTSSQNGTCKSACMDCAAGEEATIRLNYGNQTTEQIIPAWEGSDAGSCKPSYATSNPLGTFVVETEEAPEGQTQDYSEINGSKGNLPENVNIETKDYRISGSEGENYEYVSYVNTTAKKEAETSSDAGCLPFFIMLPFILLLARRS